jgi:hypothetical protein
MRFHSRRFNLSKDKFNVYGGTWVIFITRFSIEEEELPLREIKTSDLQRILRHR